MIIVVKKRKKERNYQIDKQIYQQTECEMFM